MKRIVIKKNMSSRQLEKAMDKIKEEDKRISLLNKATKMKDTLSKKK